MGHCGHLSYQWRYPTTPIGLAEAYQEAACKMNHDPVREFVSRTSSVTSFERCQVMVMGLPCFGVNKDRCHDAKFPLRWWETC